MYDYYLKKETLGVEKTCPVCGKFFIIKDSSVYVYKVSLHKNRVPVCSWKCLRTYEKTHTTKTSMNKMKAVKKQLAGKQ